MRYYYYNDDPLFFLVLVGIAIALLANGYVSLVMRRYNKVQSSRGISGAYAAKCILENYGVNGVNIVCTGAPDHYDPRNLTLNLSRKNLDETSITALAVAAHESGHAIQHAQGYPLLKLRTLSVPLANFGSTASYILILLGMMLNILGLINLGIVFFGLVVAFQLITLPVEIDASRRAVKALANMNLLSEQEMPGARKVLMAAAFTYVAALVVAVLNMLRYIALAQRRR